MIRVGVKLKFYRKKSGNGGREKSREERFLRRGEIIAVDWKRLRPASLSYGNVAGKMYNDCLSFGVDRVIAASIFALASKRRRRSAGNAE